MQRGDSDTHHLSYQHSIMFTNNNSVLGLEALCMHEKPLLRMQPHHLNIGLHIQTHPKIANADNILYVVF